MIDDTIDGNKNYELTRYDNFPLEKKKKRSTCSI